MLMAAGILSIGLYLPGNSSLKEKRQVLQSLKMKLGNKFNISVAETDYQDLRQRAELTVAAVSSDMNLLRNELNRVLETIELRDGVEIIGHDIEFI